MISRPPSSTLCPAPALFRSVVSPGHSGGTLTNGTETPGTLAIGGQDMWRFTGSAGDSIQLRVGAAGFTPRLDLYGPDGALAGHVSAPNTSFPRVNTLPRLTN